MAPFAAAPDNFAPSTVERDFHCVVFGICWFFIFLIVLLVGLLQGRRPGWGLQAELKGVASGSRCSRRPRDEKDGAFEASLREELDRRRLARAQRFVPVTLVIAVGTFCMFIANSGLIDGSEKKRFGSTVQDIVIGVYGAMLLIMWASQWAGVSVVTLRYLDYWHSALMACLVVYMSPFAIRADLVPYRMSVSLWAVGVCLFNLKPRLNIPWVLLVGITSCYTLLHGDRAESVKHAEYSSQQALADLLQQMSVVVLLLLFLNRLLTYIARLELDAKFSRNELAAATSVLSSVCEVVVDLDQKFRLQRHPGELADMLFLNPQRNLNQEDIRSFLASESDRSKFSEQMEKMVLPDSREDGPHPSSTFQVFMKDSTGAPVNVHLIAVSYTGRDGVQAFMVGISEVCDSMPLPDVGGPLEASRQRKRQRRPRPDLSWPQGALPRPPSGAPEEATSSSSGSGSDWGALDLERAPDLSAGGEPLAVWFNVLTPGYCMLHFTDDFQRLFGPCRVGDDFLAWVKETAKEQFVVWIQTSWLALSNPTRGDASIEIFSRALLFRPTQVREDRLAFSATVFLDLSANPAEAERSSSTVRMTLSNVRSMTAGGQRSRRRRSFDAAGARRSVSV